MGKEAPWINGRKTVAFHQSNDFSTMDVQKTIRDDDQATVGGASHFGDHWFKLRTVVDRSGDPLHVQGCNGVSERVQVVSDVRGSRRIEQERGSLNPWGYFPKQLQPLAR